MHVKSKLYAVISNKFRKQEKLFSGDTAEQKKIWYLRQDITELNRTFQCVCDEKNCNIDNILPWWGG
jgi:hypothetical protein